MPQSAKQGASKSKGNPGRPHYLGGFEIETGLSKEEMNDWVNEVVDRIEKSEQSEHPQIWTKRRGHRHSFAVNVTEQQAILIIRRWLKQDFFTISHYLSNWDDVYGLRARNFKGNVRIAFEAYEVGAVYLFLLTYGPYLGPGVATLAPWIPSKEFEFPDHKGAAVLCPGMKECPSMPYSEAKEYLGEHRMPESAARYTAEILKNKVPLLPDGFRTWFGLKTNSTQDRLYARLSDPFPSNEENPIEPGLPSTKPRTAKEMYEYIEFHKPKRYKGKDDQFYEFAATLMNDIIHTNSWPKFRDDKTKIFVDRDDPADPCWTAWQSLPTKDFALRRRIQHEVSPEN